MRDGEPNMYTGLCTLRNGQNQLQWSRLQMTGIFTTVAIPIVFGSGQANSLKFAVSSISFLAVSILFLAAVRGDKWIRFWDEKLAELELQDQGPGAEEESSRARVAIFSDPQFNIIRGAGITTRKVLRVAGVAFLLLWFGMAVYYGIQSLIR